MVEKDARPPDPGPAQPDIVQETAAAVPISYHFQGPGEEDVNEMLSQVTILYSPGPSQRNPQSAERGTFGLGVSDDFGDLLRWFDEGGDDDDDGGGGADDDARHTPHGSHHHSNYIMEQVVESHEDVSVVDSRPVDVTEDDDWDSALGLDVPYYDDDEGVEGWDGIVLSDEDWSEEEQMISGASTPQGGGGFETHQSDGTDKRRDAWEMDVPLAVQHADEFDGFQQLAAWSHGVEDDASGKALEIVLYD